MVSFSRRFAFAQGAGAIDAVEGVARNSLERAPANAFFPISQVPKCARAWLHCHGAKDSTSLLTVVLEASAESTVVRLLGGAFVV